MNAEFIQALYEIEKDKGISKDIILDALEAALISSYKKNFGTASNAEVDMNRETGEIKVFSIMEVVEEVLDENLEISLEEAKDIDIRYEIGDKVRIEATPLDFGRIAAQTAKQVVIQRIKDAERDVVYQEFVDRENEVITGVIQRINGSNLYIDLGRTEAILPPSEQIPTESYEQGDRLKLLVLEVKKTNRGPQIILSRSHPNLVKRLFELEVPEIHDGIVEIYSISREAGSRTKIAVFSKDPDVDPLGACVGFKGSRVKLIVDELDGEKIDIIIWSNDIAEFIANSLSPSKVLDVIIDEVEQSAIVIVPDYQLSLAIGKGGQNARLAAKLTNWKIDIKSESQYEEEKENIELELENNEEVLDLKEDSLVNDNLENEKDNEKLSETEEDTNHNFDNQIDIDSNDVLDINLEDDEDEDINIIIDKEEEIELDDLTDLNVLNELGGLDHMDYDDF